MQRELCALHTPGGIAQCLVDRRSSRFNYSSAQIFALFFCWSSPILKVPSGMQPLMLLPVFKSQIKPTY